MKLKHTWLLPVLAILLLIFSTEHVAAQEPAALTKQEKQDLQQQRNYAFLAQEDKHLTGAWLTYKQLSDAGIPVNNFEVIVIGKLAKTITEDQELKSLITEKTDGKFNVTVCDMALGKLKVDKKLLPEKAAIISNGYLRLYQLQAKDYLTIQP